MMEDRFKYRAWDIREASWVDVLEIAWAYDFDSNAYSPEPDIITESYALMQCTGIKDKGGTLIYEGDIIFSDSWWWGPGEVFLSRGHVGPCKGENVMEYVCRHKGKVSSNLWYGSEVKILGNIYENPEIIDEWVVPFQQPISSNFARRLIKEMYLNDRD